MNEDQSTWEIGIIATMQEVVDAFMAGKGLQSVTFKELPAEAGVRSRLFRVTGQDAQTRTHQFDGGINHLAQVLLYFSAERWTLPGMAHDARTLTRALARRVVCTSAIVYVATTDPRTLTYPWLQILQVPGTQANRAAALARSTSL